MDTTHTQHQKFITPLSGLVQIQVVGNQHDQYDIVYLEKDQVQSAPRQNFKNPDANESARIFAQYDSITRTHRLFQSEGFEIQKSHTQQLKRIVCDK